VTGRRTAELHGFLATQPITPGDVAKITAITATYESDKLKARPGIWTYWVGSVQKTGYLNGSDHTWISQVQGWKQEAGEGATVWPEHVFYIRIAFPPSDPVAQHHEFYIIVMRFCSATERPWAPGHTKLHRSINFIAAKDDIMPISQARENTTPAESWTH